MFESVNFLDRKCLNYTYILIYDSQTFKNVNTRIIASEMSANFPSDRQTVQTNLVVSMLYKILS